MALHFGSRLRPLLARYRRHVVNRRHYRRSRDWLWSLYNRLLRRPVGSFLPGTGRVRAVRLIHLDDAVLVRLGTTDFAVLEEIFVNGEYDAVLGLDSVRVRWVIDLGANIGLSVRLWQRHFPAAQIVAVEPDDANFALCRRNVDIGEAPERVRLLKTCIAADTRLAYLDRTRGEWGYSIISAAPDSSAAIETQTMRQLLQAMPTEASIDLLKCDIEGAERELFADCGSWIGRVANLIIELHHPYGKEMFLADVDRAGGAFEATVLSESNAVALLFLRSVTHPRYHDLSRGPAGTEARSLGHS